MDDQGPTYATDEQCGRIEWCFKHGRVADAEWGDARAIRRLVGAIEVRTDYRPEHREDGYVVTAGGLALDDADAYGVIRFPVEPPQDGRCWCDDAPDVRDLRTEYVEHRGRERACRIVLRWRPVCRAPDRGRTAVLYMADDHD